MTTTPMLDSVRTLMTGLIDYAGLFPPSKLDMSVAVENYAKYLRSEHADFLARFICPVPRLTEFTEKASVMLPGTYATSGYREQADNIDPWQLSAIIIGDLKENLEGIYAFNEHHDDEGNGLAMVDAIEMKISSVEEIDEALELIPEAIDVAFEIPADVIMGGDPRGYIAALAGGDAIAKIRCGGVEPSMIPDSVDIARFILACKAAAVAFKCTAGLHHPIRAEHPLTYEDNSVRGIMHGFVNVFFASAYARNAKSPDEPTLVAILDETDAGEFVFSNDGVRWKDISVSTTQLALSRESFATSYGSCSFDEPRQDMQALNLL
jgi:hypothetical protein